MKSKILETVNRMCSGTLMEHLGIVYTDLGDDFLTAEMEVTSKHYQPMQILHGGATLALIESAGSALSALSVDLEKYQVKGMEVNANHLRSVSSGKITAVAAFIHKGSTSQVVEVKVTDAQNRLISIARITNAIIKK